MIAFVFPLSAIACLDSLIVCDITRMCCM